MDKAYDHEYFDRWYRQSGLNSPARLARKVALAVACAEYHLERPIRSVLDIGCGEGRWRAPLLKLRPDIDYIGFDSSEYVIAKFGRQRNLHYARFADFRYLRPCAPVDLLICCDVLHYLDAREIGRGLPGLAELTAGIAYLETYCQGDEILGDQHNLQLRPARWYRQRFARAGLVSLGNHCWLPANALAHAAALELAQPAGR